MPVTCVLHCWLEAWLRHLRRLRTRLVCFGYSAHRSLAITMPAEQHLASALRDQIGQDAAFAVIDNLADPQVPAIDAHWRGVWRNHCALPRRFAFGLLSRSAMQRSRCAAISPATQPRARQPGARGTGRGNLFSATAL